MTYSQDIPTYKRQIYQALAYAAWRAEEIEVPLKSASQTWIKLQIVINSLQKDWLKPEEEKGIRTFSTTSIWDGDRRFSSGKQER